MTQREGGPQADNVVDLMPWDIAVRSAVHRREAYALIEREDADQAIQALTELELYYAVKALGAEDATPFLAVISPEQTRALFDLDVWHRDRIDVDDTLVWLGAFREISLERLQQTAAALDPELLALIFRRRLLIALKRPDDTGEPMPDWAVNPPEEILPLVETADRRFVIAARTADEADELEGRRGTIDEEERKAILQLVDDLYRDVGFETAAGILRMAEGDLSTDLEETALRFRNARLEDLGFPPPERALEIYGRVDADQVLGATETRPGPGEMRLPAIHASRLSDGLLRSALRELTDPELVHAIEGELVPLANAALVAEGVEPGDLERLGEVLDRVRAYLELALAWKAQGDLVQTAKERLMRLPLRTLFAAGWSITLAASTRARMLQRKGGLASGGQPLGLLDEADRAVLEALLEGRAAYSTILDGERPARRRPIRSPADMARIAGALDELESAAELAQKLELGAKNAALGPGIEPPQQSERSLDLLITTLAANALLDRGAELIPLDGAALHRLAERARSGAFEPAAVDAAIATVLARAGIARGAKIEQRLARGLATLAESLAPLAGKAEIDPRFVGEVVRQVQ